MEALPLTEKQVEDINILLYFQNSSLSLERIHEGYRLAVRYADEIYQETKHSITLDDLKSSLSNLGICNIRRMNGDEVLPLQKVLGFYRESAAEICYDADFLKRIDLQFMGNGSVLEAVLLHELFHHLEYSAFRPVSKYLKLNLKWKLPRSSLELWSDIGAYTFVDRFLGCGVSEVISLLTADSSLNKDFMDRLESIVPGLGALLFSTGASS